MSIFNFCFFNLSFRLHVVRRACPHGEISFALYGRDVSATLRFALREGDMTILSHLPSHSYFVILSRPVQHAVVEGSHVAKHRLSSRIHEVRSREISCNYLYGWDVSVSHCSSRHDTFFVIPLSRNPKHAPHAHKNVCT